MWLYIFVLKEWSWITYLLHCSCSFFSPFRFYHTDVYIDQELRKDWLSMLMIVTSARSSINIRHLEKATVSTGKEGLLSEGNAAYNWSRCSLTFILFSDWLWIYSCRNIFLAFLLIHSRKSVVAYCVVATNEIVVKPRNFKDYPLKLKLSLDGYSLGKRTCGCKCLTPFSWYLSSFAIKEILDVKNVIFEVDYDLTHVNRGLTNSRKATK